MQQQVIKKWSPSAAYAFCREVEAAVSPLGYHVALTGGCLYRTGWRKDCDTVIYRERGRDTPHVCLRTALASVGFVPRSIGEKFDSFVVQSTCFYQTTPKVNTLRPRPNECTTT